ncbi:MAG TPA: pyruvate dehydrogenase (acetyl-transferring), homodimeric type, partial [Microthrixaceae bacterium]|nr:pyruvate dehydrogenase (acetyl-transferring), homodimeric type [Microthrixaceae bacterium]
IEGRMEADQLDGFRREIGGGLSSYPHPRLMPDFWEYPTVSMGLGPINSIYHARFNKYLHNRRIDDTSGSRVWCFIGDGECDEPETLAGLALAGREQLDNLTWVVNCNLQRLDGPVRGNGKIIQELEATFRGAGWHVIKVIWGTKWDDLLEHDTDGLLVDQMDRTVDGQFQRYAVESGAYIREHFFGPDPRLRKLVENMSDAELESLPRGGHDTQKVYSAYKAATEVRGQPTVILAKTVKGWALGEDVESRNATHQMKKLNKAQLATLRDRLNLGDVVSDEDLEGDIPPFVRPDPESPEARYLAERRRALGGALPRRTVQERRPLALPAASVFAELLTGSGEQPVSTTTAFTRLLRNLTRDEAVGSRVVPIVPDEARTFGMDSLFRELKIYAAQGQQYEPVDHHLLLSYAEANDGQILEEGITEAGAMASWTAAATSYATRGVPMIPFFIFYSMFGFQRVGDLIWAAADARARGFLLGATAGRTTLLGEGLQHQDGHSLVLASTVPPCRAYDPSFSYELAVIIQDGIDAMYARGLDVFYYLTVYNETYPMPPMPEGRSANEIEQGIVQGLYKWMDAPTERRDATVLFSGSSWRAAYEARNTLSEVYGIGIELWSATSYKALREEALATERWNRLHPVDAPRQPLVTQKLLGASGPIVAVSDYMRMVPDQISRWVPGRWLSLGTDGFGQSDTREKLRRHFETDAAHVVVAVLSQLCLEGIVTPDVVADAITRHGLDPESVPPWSI